MFVFYLILTCFLVVAISGLCSLTEAILLSLNPVRLEALKREGKLYAALWLKLKESIDKPISAILILNTISNTGGAPIAGYLFAKVFGEEWLWLFTVGFVLAILFVSELAPKVLGAVYCERLAPTLGPWLYATTRLLSPVIKVTEAFMKPLRGKGDGEETTLSAVDIEVLAQAARQKKVIAWEQEQMIVNAAKLRTTKVKEIMLPSKWIVFLNLQNSVEKNLHITQYALHTRYPVSSSGSVNGIHGYINYKDLLAIQWGIEEMEPEDISLEAFIRPILSIDEDMDVNTALKRLTARRYHIALVKNAKDEVVGLVTLEDFVEELVGEIEDEFDQSTNVVIQVRPHFWRVGARLTMDRLETIIQRDLLLSEEEKSLPLGQWLERQISDARYPGMSYQYENVDFYVQQARRGRVFQVLVEVLDEGDQADVKAGGVISDLTE